MLPFADMSENKDQEYFSDGLTEEQDQAFQWLARAYQQRDGGLASIQWDPLVVSLRGDSRYIALLRKMKFPEQTASR